MMTLEGDKWSCLTAPAHIFKLNPLLIIINLQIVNVVIMKVNIMDFSCGNVESLPRNYQIRANGFRIVSVHLDIFSSDKYLQKAYQDVQKMNFQQI